ncbi:MAG: hypothetical protein JWP28_2368 [Phenylobacterium sp.]|uniref:terminase small subunit-like protein n=1 Tax=Phenylobacterium sp. TaxID=1871053 RepID=UPI00260484BC|nr:hypothetical protein [Phenylobacterium sp.]MDB5498337.1 hypothetical protein [Phenylobacterium sp.]
MTDDDLPARPGRRSYVRFSAALGRAICERVASGETEASICRDTGMPDRDTLRRWAKTLPVFGAELARARAAGGRRVYHGVPSIYDATIAQAFYERVCEGESVLAICRDPQMPSFGSFYRWRKHNPDFAKLMAEARAIQAERFCDLGWEIASAVTPETAYATQVKLGQLRWTAGVLAPRKYGRTKPGEFDEEGTGGDFVVVVKRFSDAPLPDGTVLAPGESREVRRRPMLRGRNEDEAEDE